jgi:hypothetical protein
MTVSSEQAGSGAWNYWRVARWTAALVLLLVPAVMMRISSEWHWGIGSFVVAGLMIGGVALLYELAEKASGSRAYRAGVAIVLVTSFLTVWTTIVRDDGNGIGFLLLVLTAAVGAFAAWFRPAGMARAMLGVAVMQALVGVAIATAPVTASVPDGPFKALMFSGVFSGLWLISAMFFRAAEREGRGG